MIVVLVGGPRLTPYLGGPKSLGGPNLVGGTSDPSTYHVLTMWRCGDMDISSFSAISLAKNGCVEGDDEFENIQHFHSQ